MKKRFLRKGRAKIASEAEAEAEAEAAPVDESKQQQDSMTGKSEMSPLLSSTDTESLLKESSYKATANGSSNILARSKTTTSTTSKVCQTIIKGLESMVDWSPFIVVNVLFGNGQSASPEVALGSGVVAAAFILLYSYLKKQWSDLSKSQEELQSTAPYKPKMLEIGQFILFFGLYVFAILLNIIEGSARSRIFLVLWFNSITTGGMALIMWYSLFTGRPFVFDYVEQSMPQALWNRLSSQKWFLDILTQVAMFWVKILAAMTLIVTIIPVLVTCFYGGDPNNDPSGRMTLWGNILSGCQLPLFIYAMYVMIQEDGKEERHRRRSVHVRENGLEPKDEDRYKDLLMLNMPFESFMTGKDLNYTKNLRIESLSKQDDLERAAYVLTKAFEKDHTMENFIDSFEDRLSFYQASVKSLAYFKHVLAVYDDSNTSSNQDPCCVMVVIPNLSKSHEETEVFNDYQSWVEHGFEISGATEDDFPLPSDDLMELGQMKNRTKHGLSKRKHLTIAHFGADPDHKGKGYGRVLGKYITYVADYHQLPIILEATYAHNIVHYEKYGFKVIDRLKEKPDWVLMLRECGGYK